ncbi:MAG: 4Fe-4S dicluster domain-containing protein [Rhodothermales bacterium]|nr:4Fe-4S dicluster domain-containing protein [Rhodothermales bacterium]
MQADEALAPESATGELTKTAVITSSALDDLLTSLAKDGFSVIGPTRRGDTIVLGEIGGTRDLPDGWIDHHAPGKYRLEHSETNRVFDCTIGAHAWKKYLFPARRRLWSASRNGSPASVEFQSEESDTPPYAFVGVRACDLAAIAIQDRVFMGGSHPDPVYSKRRNTAVIIAVNCTRAVDSCFCASMGTGPRATGGFDLALTEIPHKARTAFVVETGSPRGAELLSRIASRPADKKSLARARSLRQQAVDDQHRTLDPDATRQLLLESLNHPEWKTVDERCLSCGNCTMVCPTCFCSTVEDTTDLTGTAAERWQVWDSCFNPDHSYIHGGYVRKTTGSRYRQWITHKLATWKDQFGTSGCVGCGRCITWCPVAIDITEEVRAIDPNGRKVGPGRRK